ncbi:MAG: sugar ABC transporter permease [bacterium]|nr:sugar ABC transporter permease [bacterium]
MLGVVINILMGAVIAVAAALWIDRAGPASKTRRAVALVVGIALGALSLWGVFAVEKLETTARGVVVSILASALIFIAANKLFDLPPDRWSVFTTLVGAGGAFVIFALLWGNRAIDDPVLRTVVGTLVGAVAGYLLGTVQERWARLAIGIGAGGALGALAASGMRKVVLVFELERGTFELWPVLPLIDYGAVAIATLVGAAIGILLWQLRGRRTPPARPLILGATLGFFVGGWLLPSLGSGTKTDALVAAMGVGVGVGALLGLKPIPDAAHRGRIEGSSRAYIFLIPALGFIAATLIIPTLRTLFLSFHDPRGQEFVGFVNYRDIFSSPNIFNLEGWAGIFGSKLFVVGAVLLLIGVVVSIVVGRRSGYSISFSPGSGGVTAVGVVLVAFAIFAALRGTVFNNLWWVFTVTVLSASAGLAIAVLADRARWESVAKSLIFMPMAISFVGAGVIWRFMYLARDVSKPQTGVLNTVWVGIGELSLSRGPGFFLAVIVSLGLAALLAILAFRAWKAGERTVGLGAAVTSLPLIWFAYALWRGVGGFEVRENGDIVASTIQFVQKAPYNNVWLMLVLIWIQTGFTMVIFSAAIKAVPSDLLEAARVDGASESQTFWRVIIPQIYPTIGVVVTTLIVLVMKVFDIVKVMTNGNFGTQVIANEMWQRAFTELNFGLGSALAVVLFIAVLPILFINIRRMQRAAA